MWIYYAVQWELFEDGNLISWLIDSCQELEAEPGQLAQLTSGQEMRSIK